MVRDITMTFSSQKEAIMEVLQGPFDAYATNEGVVTHRQALFALADCGLLEGLGVNKVVQFVIEAELAHMGNQIRLEEFERCVAGALRAHMRQTRHRPPPPKGFPNAPLKDLFAHLCGAKSEKEASRALRMDAQTLVHACKDAGLLGKALSRDSVNVIFARVRSAGEVSIVYEQFLSAITLMCKELDASFEGTAAALINTVQRPGHARGDSHHHLPPPHPNHHPASSSSGRWGSASSSHAPLSPQSSNGGSVLSSRSHLSQSPSALGMTPRSHRGVGGVGCFDLRPGHITAQELVSRATKPGRPIKPPRGGVSNHQAAMVGGKNRQATEQEKETFAKMDKKGTGRISSADLSSAFTHLGLFEDLGPDETKLGFVHSVLEQRGAATQDLFTMKQFVRLVSTAELMRRSRQGGAGGLMSQDARNYLRSRELRSIFHSYAAFGSGVEHGHESSVKHMDSSRFAKMVRECGLLKKKKETPAGIVDLIYAKAKPLNGRRLEFKHFLEALALIAQQNQSTMERVVERLTDVGGPQKTHVTHQDEFHFATMEKSAAVESVFFALDSNGTGCIMKEEVVFALADLGAFDGINSRVAGQAVASAMKQVEGADTVQLREFEGIVEQLLRLRANKFNTTKHAVGVPSTFRNDESLRQVFLDFCQHDVVGSAHKPSTMQPSQFAALCKDCGLKDKAHPLPALEIVFANSTPKGERDMYFSHFLQALAALATDKCETFEFVVGKVLHTEAPLPPSTPESRAQSVVDGQLLREAEEAYQAYDVVKDGRVDKLELMLVLADLHAFGEHSNTELHNHFEHVFQEMAPHDHMITLERFPEIFYAVQAFKPKEGAGAVGRAASVPLHYQANQELREAFEQFGASLTHTAFTKLVMDCGLTDFVRVTNQSCTMIFARSRRKGSRTMDYLDFLRALALIATDMHMRFDQMADSVIAAASKLSNAASPAPASSSKNARLLPVQEVEDAREVDYQSMQDNLDSSPAPPPAPPFDEADASVRGLTYNSAFESYDVANTGIIDQEELPFVLADIGLLDGINCAVAATEIANTYQEIGTDNSGSITPEDFSIFCLKLDRLKRNMTEPLMVPILVSSSVQENAELRRIFTEACSFGDPHDARMHGVRFSKLLDRSGILDRKFTHQAADVCFARAKEKEQHTLTYAQFLRALAYVAESKSASLETLAECVMEGDMSSDANLTSRATQDTFSSLTLQRRPPGGAEKEEVLSIEELIFSLADTGLFDGLLCQSVADTINTTLDELLSNANREPVMQDFEAFREALLDLRASGHATQRAANTLVSTKCTSNQALYAAFLRLCTAAPEEGPSGGMQRRRLDLTAFQKLVFDMDNPELTEEAASIAFAQSRAVELTTVSFTQFLYALALLTNGGAAFDKALAFVVGQDPQEASPAKEPESSNPAPSSVSPMSKSAAAVAAAQSGWGALGASANPEAFVPPPDQASTVEPDLPVPTPVKEKEAMPATRPKPGSQKEKVLSVPTPSPRSIHADLVQLAFDMHAENGKLGCLQMIFTLGQLGSLEKLDHRRAGHLATEMLSRADSDGDGYITSQEFLKLYTEFVKAYGQPEKLGNAYEMPKGMSKEVWNNENLARIFLMNCAAPNTDIKSASMQCSTFVEFCTKSNLVDPYLTTVALEVIYSKAKAMERTKTLFYAGFRHALNYLSEDKNVTFAATVEQLIALNPPERKQLIGLVSSGTDYVPSASTPVRPLSVAATAVEQKKKGKGGVHKLKKMFGFSK